MKETVLVTGGTGFIGGWTIVALPRAGYRVRTTVCSLARAERVRRAVSSQVDAGDQLSIVEADLGVDDG